MNSNEKIIQILNDNGIRNIRAVDNCSLLNNREGNDTLCGDESTWVASIFSIIKEDMEKYNTQLADGKKKYITFSDDSDDILKYTCMFPNFSINLKGKFDEYQSTRGPIYYTIPKQYIRSYIMHKDLIQMGTYRMLPEIIMESGDQECDNAGQYTTWSLTGKREYYNNCLVHEVDVLGPNGIFLSNENIDKLYCEFPWLYGVSIEDYIDIVNKNRSLYNNYCTTILKFTEAVHNGDYSSLKQEMKEANNSIKCELEEAQDRLRRRGIETVLSLAFTFIPMVAPLPEEQKVILSTVLGATSLKEIFMKFSDEIAALRKVGKSSPFWLMYQWQKKVNLDQMIY